MKNNIRLIFSLISIMLLHQNLHAQELIEIIPYSSGTLTQDGLWNFSVTNTGTSSKKCALRISVVIDGEIPLVEIITPSFVLQPGLNDEFSELKTSSLYDYYPNKYSDELQNNSFLNYQRINICISLYRGEENSLASKVCREYSSVKVRALHLISPLNEEVIETSTPLLHWEGVNIPLEIPYHLRLCELLDGEDKETALDLNPPLLDVDVQGITLQYPENMPVLESNKTYVWNVVASESEKILAVSEIWTFTLKDKNISATNDEGYRMITKSLNTDNYLFNKKINFTYENRTNERILPYTIRNVKSNKKLGDLPEIKIVSGLNKISIDISDILGIKRNELYFLTISNSSHADYQMSFQIINP